MRKLSESQLGESSKIDKESSVDKQKYVAFFIAIMVLIIVAIYLVGQMPEPASHLKNVFLDVNGDGLIDLIKDAKVILNTGTNITFP